MRRRGEGRRRPRWLTAAIAVALTALAPASAHAAIVARGSAEQVQVTGAKPDQEVTLEGVRTQRAGSLGGVVFRDVKPGRYSVAGKSVTVFSDRSAPPSTKVYGQRIPRSGYGYLTTRDGTQLAIDVHLPLAAGPYPTLIEYSGYGYADPAGGESSIAPIANLLGFAVVDVNMRGTGCSGGAFDYFEPLQGLDGYDVIETVARQSWVLDHEVGMMGISYGGISQLFVAETRPPHLSAITPLSVIDDTATTLYPGGLLNTGFALTWGEDRAHDAKPASATGGQAWALKRIKGGDELCKSNQVLHAEAPNLLAKLRANSTYDPKVADPLAPVTFVHKIDVPVFLACQFTDEQTGGHCPALASRFTGTSKKWFTFSNGTHIDSLDPATLNRWYDFLSLYVAKRAPAMPAAAKVAAPAVYAASMGVAGVTLPPDPLQGLTYPAALAAFEQLPPVRILFDDGAGSLPGYPFAGFEQSFARFPVPGTTGLSFALGSGSFKWNPAARPKRDFSGDTGAGGLWTALPHYSWVVAPAGSAVTFTTPPLAVNTVVIGAGALSASIKATAGDVDLQVTVSEVRPDGHETFVQSGWLRASQRKLDAKKSTPLEPILSRRAADVAPLPKGRFTPLTVPLYYEGHAYRAGSAIRVTISAPGGDQPVWAFGDVPKDTATVDVRDAKLLLPVVAGINVPTPLPLCLGLRGEPCR
jgi:predicted acyl esterase